MKKLLIWASALLLLSGCGESVEKRAEAKLQQAREAFEAGNLGEAKTEIDSIKILYPKAVKARKESITLMKQVEQQEQKQTIAYLDSVLLEKETAFQKIKERFVLEKDAEYQQIGNYLHPTQVIEKNLHRSFLRFQVSEQGILVMTSIYCGAAHIHHTAVKVISPDGTFAQTSASKDCYETTDLNEKIEKSDYKMGADGNVMGFIYLNNSKNIKVEYLGEKKYTTTMSANDRKALTELFELSQVLSSLEQVKAELKEAHLKLKFVEQKLQEKEQEVL